MYPCIGKGLQERIKTPVINPIKVGSIDMVAEVDETYFRKRKYKRSGCTKDSGYWWG